MKLLEKSELDRKRTVDKKLEVDQGAILAKKIDALRELYSFEEARINLFREESLKQIKEEMSDGYNTIKAYSEEIAKLRIERQKLLEPIDKEWKQLLYSQSVLDKEQERNLVWEKELSVKCNSLTDKEILLIQRTKQINQKEEQITNLMISTENREKQANNLLERSKKQSLTIHSKIKEATDKLITRETDIAVRERDLLIQEQHLKSFEDTLNREQLHIYSQQQQLKAAYKAIKNK